MGTIMTTLTARTNAETKELFRECFEASGADSQGDFIRKLLDKWNQEEPIYKPEIKTEYVTEYIEKKLDQNQILLTLSPVQYFALRAGVLSYPDFAEKQNEIIDSLKKGAPFFYSGYLYDSEFNDIWIRNIALTKAMTEEEKEIAILHNMSAFLLNMYLMNVIEENLGTIRIKPGHLKSYIRKIKEAETKEKQTETKTEEKVNDNE